MCLSRRKLRLRCLTWILPRAQVTIWPAAVEESGWVPEFKKDNKQNIKNYRPVTVLSVLGKVFERLLSKQLTSFIDPMLSSNLTAYGKNQSWIFERKVYIHHETEYRR